MHAHTTTAQASEPRPAPEPVVIDTPESTEQACERLTELLGRTERVSEAVLRAAIDDPLYAMHLLASRKAPRLLDILLENPPKPTNAHALSQAAPAAAADQSTPVLLKRFGKAMVAWGKAGFKTADEETFRKRLAACSACPDLRGERDAPTAGRPDLSVALGQTCGLCGCLVRAKARIARENCPGRDRDDGRLSRWGEPLRP